MISNVTQFRVDLDHLAARISATISKGNTPFTRLLMKKKAAAATFCHTCERGAAFIQVVAMFRREQKAKPASHPANHPEHFANQLFA
jgi:hypothetical protein